MKTYSRMRKAAVVSVTLSSLCLATEGQSFKTSQTLDGQLYVGLDAGAAMLQDVKLRDSVGDSETISYRTGACLDAQLGYQIATDWAVELVASPHLLIQLL